MATTSVRDIELMLPGSFGKEVLSNDGMENLAIGISGTLAIPLTGHVTLTDAQARHFVLILTGALTAHVNVTVPADPRVYIVDNRTTGAFNVTLFPSAGGGVAAEQGARTLVYCDGSNVYPVASGTGGAGGSGAPTDATYLVQTPHALLSAERAVTDTATVVWDFATPGVARAVIPDGAVTYGKFQDVTPTRLLGRFTAGAGDAQEITLGAGLALDGSGVLTATVSGAQPLDATLTALAGLPTAADTLPYFTGVDTAALTPISAQARSLLFAANAAAQQAIIGVIPGTDVQAQDATLSALAGVTTGADRLPFFTGVDTASTTVLSPLARALLDDTTQAAMQATIGVTPGGGATPGGTTGQVQYNSAGAFGGSSALTLDATTLLTLAPLTTKGDLLVQGATAPARLAVGTNGQVLIADSAEASGIKWATPASGGSTTFVALTDTPDTYTGQALKILRANAAETATEFGPVLGTMAEQNASAVAITGGTATFTGNVTGSNRTGSSQYGFVTSLNAAGGADRYAFLGTGDAPSVFNGRVSANLGLTVQQTAGSDQTAIFSSMVASTGTGRYFISHVGDAQSSFGGLLIAAAALRVGTTTDTTNGNIRYTGTDFEGRVAGAWVSLTAGGGGQPLDATLTALAGLATGVDQLPYFTGTDTAAQTPLTPAGRALLDDADAAAQRTTLGLGTMATQNANAVAITGGSVSGSTLVDLADRAGNDQYGFVARMNTAGGTGRYAFFSAGTAPNYFAGNVGIANPTPSYPLDVVGIARLQGHLVLGGAFAPLSGFTGKATLWMAKASGHGLMIVPSDGDGGSGASVMFCNAGGAQIGTITTTATTTAYNTSSDVRLKHSIAPLTGSLDVIAALNPVAHRWNVDDSYAENFLAHELQQVLAYAVTGEPDAVNVNGEILPQQVDLSKCVPRLVGAIKELLVRVEALETALGV